MLEENFGIVLIMIKKNLAKKPALITLLILSLPISAESFQDGLIDKLNSSITDIGFKKDHIISDDGVMINYYIKGSKKNALVLCMAIVAAVNTGGHNWNIFQKTIPQLLLILRVMGSQD